MASKKQTTSCLVELLKRVPPNQMKQFAVFRDKTKKYQKRVNEYPEKLPRIDWEYYRNNVREDYVQMVEQFQVKYEELKHVFGSRQEALDFSKYYKKLDELTEQAQNDVQNYIEESNDRIKIYQNEIKRLKSLTPYEDMTLEQFVTEREEIALYIPGQGKPLFWPHDPAEQMPDYVQHFDEKIKKKYLKLAIIDENKIAKTISKAEAQTKSDLDTVQVLEDAEVETKPKSDKIENDETQDHPKIDGLSNSPTDDKPKDPTNK